MSPESSLSRVTLKNYASEIGIFAAMPPFKHNKKHQSFQTSLLFLSVTIYHLFLNPVEVLLQIKQLILCSCILLVASSLAEHKTLMHIYLF